MKFSTSLTLILFISCTQEQPPKLPAPEYRQAELPDWSPPQSDQQDLELDDLDLEWVDETDESSFAGASGEAEPG